jgi:hypothetical protein
MAAYGDHSFPGNLWVISPPFLPDGISVKRKAFFHQKSKQKQ